MYHMTYFSWQNLSRNHYAITPNHSPFHKASDITPESENPSDTETFHLKCERRVPGRWVKFTLSSRFHPTSNHKGKEVQLNFDYFRLVTSRPIYKRGSRLESYLRRLIKFWGPALVFLFLYKKTLGSSRDPPFYVVIPSINPERSQESTNWTGVTRKPINY